MYKNISDSAAAFGGGISFDLATTGGTNALLVALITIVTPFLKDAVIYLSKKFFNAKHS